MSEKRARSPKSFRDKVLPLHALARALRKVRAGGKRVVHAHGVFDLLHPGHIRHLEAAKAEGDILVVTLTPDEHVNKGPGRPVFNQRLRAESIAALACVDYVAVNEGPTAVETIRLVKPDLYVKGEDYADPAADVTGKIREETAAVEAVGGRLHITRDITFSSSQLLNTYFDVYPEHARVFLKKFRKRHGAGEITAALQSLRKLRVLIVGDTILDEYHYVSPFGRSIKESILATRYLWDEVFPGGVLACANQLAVFCGEVELVTCLGGRDDREEYIRRHLRPNVRATFFRRDDALTIVKRRYVDASFLHKLFQVSFLDDAPLPATVEDQLLGHLRQAVRGADLVCVADYGHGLIGPRTVKALADSSGWLALNVQTNSANLGFNVITKYPRGDYICIDEPEMRLAMREKYADLGTLVASLSRRLRCSRITVTRGHMGCVTYDREKGIFEAPVFSTKVVDRMGAGDAFFSVTAPCVAARLPMDVVGFVGNAVGAIAVTIVGNRSVIEPASLYKYIASLLR